MAPAQQRLRLLECVADRIPSATHDACVRVAIDGVDGAGKTTFANELSDVVRAAGRTVIRASVDDFHHERAVRYRCGRGSPEGFWLDSFDYASLRRELLDPLGPGGSRRYRPGVHDVATDRALDIPPSTAPPGAVLLLDGLFLHRDELVHEWDLSVFLEVPFQVGVARMAHRDGSHSDPDHPSLARYVQGQRQYFNACTPRDRANLVIDNTDPDLPRLIVSR